MLTKRTTFEGVRCKGCGAQGGMGVHDTEKHGWFITSRPSGHELFTADAWCPDCVSYHFRQKEKEKKPSK